MKDMGTHDELDDDMEPLLHEEEPARRNRTFLGDSLDRESRGWLSTQEREPRSGHTSPSPSTFGPTAPIVAYSEELYRRMLKKSQNAGGYREARGRRTAWIVIDTDAKRSFMQADKRSITHQLGLKIPIRDLRLMDFNLIGSDAGSILVRDNAIIFTIEHVRLIVTADKVLVPREGYEHNPLANRFVDVLEEAVADWVRQRERERRRQARAEAAEQSDLEDDSSGAMRHDLQLMPFELVVLEAALKEVVHSSALAVKELEGLALPSLDALTKSVSTTNLERVRKVKTRHQRLVIRVETLRDELQRFLDDDDDMVKMCLTRKKELEEMYRAAAATALAEATAAAAADSAGRGTPGGVPPGGLSGAAPGWGGGGVSQMAGSMHSMGGVGSMPRRSPLAAMILQQQQRLAAAAANAAQPPLSPFPPGAHPPTREGSNGFSLQQLQQTGPPDDEYEEDAEDVENLLESYFAQVDGLWDKLTSVGEYIKDTEEYINIELDSNRNRLIRLDIILTAATFAIAPFNLIAGILGENLVIPSFLTEGVRSFWILNAVALAAVMTFFAIIMLHMRIKKLI